VPGDHVVCCDADGRLVINDHPVDESDFLFQGDKPADNVKFDVVVPADKIFVLGDHRYVSGDSSRQQGEDMFVPIDDVVGRAFAVIWPIGNMHVIDVPEVYDDVPEGQEPPAAGIINKPAGGASGNR
jgi:signal peptidase I